MKKFISMVMAAAMVVSMVPATAFAATGEVTAKSVKVVNAAELAEDVAQISGEDTPEVQIKIDDVTTNKTGDDAIVQEVTISIEDAVFTQSNGSEDIAVNTLLNRISFNGTVNKTGEAVATKTIDGVTFTITDWDDDFVTFEISCKAGALKENDVIAFDLMSLLDSDNVGSKATVTVETDIVDGDIEDVVYAEVVEKGIDVTLKEVAEAAVEADEIALKKELKIETVIGKFEEGMEIEMKLSKGFEWDMTEAAMNAIDGVSKADIDEDVFKFTVDFDDDVKDVIKFPVGTLLVEAVSAKAGDVATITVKASDVKVDGEMVGFDGKASVEAIKILEDAVIVSVDEDEDVPVMWAGVDAENNGLNADSDDHWSLEVTVEESVNDAWDFKKAFDMTLTEGVFVTDVKVTDIDDVIVYGDKNEAEIGTDDARDLFAKAYVDGEDYFKFGRKVMDATEKGKATISFQLELVAEPDFTGDVVLEVAGQEVVIANFVAPYTVTAAQNDLIIDYRYTKVPTDVVITEAEAGLWESGLEFGLTVERMQAEGDPEVTVNEESEMTVDVDGFTFEVDDESEDEAAVVTISGIELYMSRDLAAGAYDLYLTSDLLFEGNTNKEDVGYLAQPLFGNDDDFAALKSENNVVADVTDVDLYKDGKEVTGGYYTVKEGFVNIVTAGRDADDASFTTKVVVPVGEAYIIAGEQQVALDVPAYVSAAGYTMLPVRAVAVALGILNNNVLWDQATKTVTILYGQRIITMQVGAKVVYVNGSAIPASASPEVVDGRTFLPMRDLATALGVTDITWDAATKTATLNGNK